MTPRDEVSAANEHALFADGFDDAIVGHVEQFGRPPVALYDLEKCIEILMSRDKMSVAEAREFFDFNVLGSGVGENTPAFAMFLEKSGAKEKRKRVRSTGS